MNATQSKTSKRMTAAMDNKNMALRFMLILSTAEWFA
jgi:hypothetical protein